MTTIKFSQEEALVTKSWMTGWFEKITAILFGNNRPVTALTTVNTCNNEWETEVCLLEAEIQSLYNQTALQLIPMAGVYQQHLIDTLLQASTVYAPEEAESVFSEEVQIIEDIKGHVSGIQHNTKKIQEATTKASDISDIQSKAVIYHHTMKPYLTTLRFHIDQLKRIIYK
ncbi:glutamine synthetase [Parabacteroides sp. PF5-9]|uniref:glutamine synthetase n=1 Tax=Parabacteroides sp. PF5-9 TaxID=1742404 RepID=UPI002475703A|nr:glutamine synthetase [Parabacteroides sp. PF5-9]MDH6359153.1 glutamine synthetase type III [Parabacteroides sp. PF5-9]